MLKKPKLDEDNRKNFLKRRFRMFVRLVIWNKKWLMDSTNQKLGSNVKRNIILLVRSQSIVGLLTLHEKSLIRTANWSRTKEEKKRIVLLLSTLKCFKKYPPKIRARLAPVIQHMHLDENKTLIREGCAPIYVYFILTGEVILSKKVNNVEEIKYICGPGTSLGDIEIVENKKRQFTGVTLADTELLSLLIDDYNRIIRPFMQHQCDQKKQVLKMFDCFKNWTDEQVCFVLQFGILAEYQPLETIFFEDKGLLNMVYFLVSGQCMILQCLRIKYFSKEPNRKPELCPLDEGDSKLMLERLSDTELLKRFNMENLRNETTNTIIANFDLSDDFDSTTSSESLLIKAMKKDDALKYVSPCGIKLGPDTLEDGYDLHEIFQNVDTTSTETGGQSQLTLGRARSQFAQSIFNLQKSFISASLARRTRISTRIGNYILKNVFVDGGSFSHGAIFGLGEKMENRAIIARTTVQCLMIPRFWLNKKEQNIGNKWNRIRNTLNSTIPSRAALFDDFIRTKKWFKFKKDYIHRLTEEFVREGNPTQISDIPVICRILENI